MEVLLNLFFQFDFWLIALGSVLIIRQLCLILAAEQGRKHDLIKKLYKANMDFHLSVLIPFLDSSKQDSLLGLIKAIENQEYPATKVSIHIVATEQTIGDLEAVQFHPNVKTWAYPAMKSNNSDATRWLIERCIAAGGAGLLVMLKPDDIIKPDFFQNIVARSFDSFAIQGYVAIKQRPESLMGKVLGLSERLANRIDNAGRYHLGMSCQLMDTGWVIKQEVLEMIPFHRGWDISNFEYTLRLNLQNFKVTWAPNVVVYTDEQTDFIQHLTDCLAAFVNRVQLMFTYGYKLVFLAIEEWDYGYFEQFLTIVKPPNFVLGLFLVVMSMTAANPHNPIPGSSFSWGLLAIAFVMVQLLSLFVARCKGSDYITFFIYTPIVYLAGIASLPIALINYFAGLMIRAGQMREERSYRKITTTRFNEALDPYPTLLEPENGHNSNMLDYNGLKKRPPTLQEVLSSPQDTLRNHSQQQHSAQMLQYDNSVPTTSNRPSDRIRKRGAHEQTKTVSISNGQKEISCVLKTVTTYNPDGDETYQMTLEYKTVAFSTATYKILDQAFYELHAKLQSRGFTLMTCGTCGNFYNPTADMPGALKNSGVCLFGKMGKEVNLTTDAVTVLSQACPYHCDIIDRESILREWRESLSSIQYN